MRRGDSGSQAGRATSKNEDVAFNRDGTAACGW